MVLYVLFHLGQAFCQLPLHDTLHQGFLVDQETHVIADELLGCSLQF